MGSTSFNPTNYSAAVNSLRSNGKAFSASAKAISSGDPWNHIDTILNPKKMGKLGVRECCFTSGFNDATAIVISLDATGSMQRVPQDLQQQLPSLIKMLTDQGVTDRPNICFMIHDDERFVPNAAFQMSQFETGTDELLKALNEGIFPGQGGGNFSEGYHISFYAAANKTRLESYERDGTKGFFILIGDEMPFFENENPSKKGMTQELAETIFGDKLQEEVSMLESIKRTAEKFHIFVIRPGHTQHGSNKKVTKAWQDLLEEAGVNRQHVIEIAETDAIVSTIATAIGRLTGIDDEGMIEVLKKSGATGVDAAIVAVRSIAPQTGLVTSTVTGLDTPDTPTTGRKRN